MGNPNEQSPVYPVNEIFYSLQGEGFWQGTPAVFIRFSGCNLRCNFCDTEFLSGIDMNIVEIMRAIEHFPAKRVIFTGGEPLMRPTEPLAKSLRMVGYQIHVETNGMFAPGHDLFHWLTVSPKNDKLKIDKCNELKIVLGNGDVPPEFKITAQHYFISPKNPTHEGKIGTSSANQIDPETLKYCIQYVKNNPKWRLSVQLHKYIGVQ